MENNTGVAESYGTIVVFIYTTTYSYV